jgi:hypothetical protein
MVAGFAEKIAEGRVVLAASSRFCMARRTKATVSMGWLDLVFLTDFLRHLIAMNCIFAIQGFEIDFDNFIDQLMDMPNLIENGFE